MFIEVQQLRYWDNRFTNLVRIQRPF